MTKLPEQPRKSKIEKRGGNPLPRRGPSLFGVDPRAVESGKRACDAICLLLSAQKADAEMLKHLKERLDLICRFYWADFDYDNQATFGDVKEELRLFARQLADFLSNLQSLSIATRSVINSKHGGRYSGGQDALLPSTETVLISLGKAAQAIAAEEFKRGKAISINNCCKQLWILREQLTNQPFVLNFDAPKQERFKAKDALFVQIAMTAIDPNVILGTIQSNLRIIAKAKRDAKKRADVWVEAEDFAVPLRQTSTTPGSD